MLGRRVGNYKIVSVLGRGGASVVYRAAHVHLPRTDALKLLSREAAADATQMGRFLDEARALGQLRHPGVVAIFDCGPLDGGAYLAMELLHGETVETRLAREGALPLAFVVDVATQLAAALDVVHAAGIVHRDIKPANVFLMSDDDQPFGVRVKLLDFGIAKHERSSAGRRTAEGAIVGTPQYMSPEQCTGAEVDRRADVYTLGVLVYEMATGRPPFSYDNLGDVLNAHLTEAPPPPWKLRPDLPLPFASAVARALAKHPDDRFSTAGELAAAIALPRSASAKLRIEARTQPMNPITAESPRVAEPLPRPTLDDLELLPPRNRAPAFALAAALALALALAILFALRPSEKPAIALPPPPIVPSAALVVDEPPPPPPRRETYVPAPLPPRPPAPPSRRTQPPRAIAAPLPPPPPVAPALPRAKADLKNPFGD